MNLERVAYILIVGIIVVVLLIVLLRVAGVAL